MARFTIITVIGLVLSLCLCSCSVGSVRQDEIQDTELNILTTGTLKYALNIPYKRCLEASLPDCEWVLVNGSLPLGVDLEPDGSFDGVAKELGEVGHFTVRAINGDLVDEKQIDFKVIDVPWINPAKVTVDNYYCGARAEQIINVHNDYSVTQQVTKVITEESDIVDEYGYVTWPVPINQKLHNGNISNVLSVVSDNTLDNLKVQGYEDREDGGAIVISGFYPLTERIIQINYISDSLYSVDYETYDADVGDWVYIDKREFILEPHETEEVLIALEIPRGVEMDREQFEFRVSIGKAVKTVRGINVANAMVCRWIVNMR